jgi:hypothetical protein
MRPDWPDGVPQQQIHLDLWVDDFEAAHDEVMALGATLLQGAEDTDDADNFQVYADPAGHPFCLGWVRKRLRRLRHDAAGGTHHSGLDLGTPEPGETYVRVKYSSATRRLPSPVARITTVPVAQQIPGSTTTYNSRI